MIRKGILCRYCTAHGAARRIRDGGVYPGSCLSPAQRDFGRQRPEATHRADVNNKSRIEGATDMPASPIIRWGTWFAIRGSLTHGHRSIRFEIAGACGPT